MRDPQGNTLISLPHLDIRKGDTVWINGPSGLGKSTLIKTIAGLWPHCGGHIEIPAARHFYTTQKTYLPLGDLAAAATYPLPPEELGAGVGQLLEHVGLKPNSEAAQSSSGADTGFNLSGGEHQRLVIARILAARPDWIFLDETTSALLDARAEEELLTLLRSELPEATFIVVAHREPGGLGPLRRIDLESPSKADRRELALV